MLCFAKAAACITCAACLWACEGTQQVTPVEFFHDATRVCLDETGSVPQFDTYVVSVFASVSTQSLPATLRGCAECIADPQTCVLQQTQCFCGGPTSAQQPAAALAMALRGQPLSAQLTDDTQNCIRVRALERGSIASQGAARTCRCDEAWLRSNNNAVCAVSAPLVPSGVPFTLRVQCPADENHNLCEPDAAL